MNSAEIQIQFPKPGQWDEFDLTAIYQDSDGYTRTERCTADEIPAEQAPAMQAVVAALVGLGEDWQAVQVWARLDHVLASWPISEDGPFEMAEAISLTVEAVNEQGGRRIFTPAQYQEFTIKDPAAVAFFKHFTTRYEHE
ncbi:hypothetical protein [Akkermansia sp.]|uniref:hypothetical protein n=1 Tax=Akkermansia sp. TaxID=1872421 RepID=UPI0025C4172F|nr:hypothetical protein [Akkermansia sp.]MCD8271620.1 hypothetical protein [Akkermansia sp.]